MAAMPLLWQSRAPLASTDISSIVQIKRAQDGYSDLAAACALRATSRQICCLGAEQMNSGKIEKLVLCDRYRP